MIRSLARTILHKNRTPGGSVATGDSTIPIRVRLAGTVKGFTLIELMMVVVIIGILAAIAIPRYASIIARAREGSVKANAHCCQLTAESDAMQNSGIYPLVLLPAMFPGGILPENPFTGAPTVIGALGGAVEGNCNYGVAANVYTVEGVGEGGNIVITLTSG